MSTQVKNSLAVPKGIQPSLSGFPGIILIKV